MKLEKEQIILDAIFEYLATTGIEIDNNKFAIDTFQANNCTVTDDFFVKIPVDVAKRALATTPNSFKWWNRSGDKYIEFGDGGKYVAGDLRAPTYYNPETKTVEEANSQALINAVKMSNYLPNVDINGSLISTDNFRLDNANVICNTNMPMVLGAGNDQFELQSLADMAVVVRGNKEKLIEKPFLATIVSIFMLKLPSFILEQIRIGAEYGIPMLMSTTPIAGISGPVTIPGNTHFGLTTTLTGIILAQLAKPGTPCVEFLWSLYMDQANGKVSGMPENYLGEKFRMGISKELLRIPVFDGTTCASNSLSFNQDAVFELSYHFSESYKGVTDGYLGVGDIETGMVFSPHALIFFNELFDMAKRENEDIEINETTLPIELITKVKNGVYGAERHTFENMNSSLWRGKFFHHKKTNPSLDIFDRLDLCYKEIIAQSKSEKLEVEKEKEIMKLANV